ncbi:hypothetical protein IW140_002750 [Coemansia sp. RSA 1813]|nr:hypothetical protein EV178_003630 [Coemansia sp. RSA 1646]KAJ1769106.1 hypothetical protein LPJ74_004340 [Coemansia sp. RSA 1843]KAJ2088386.1 hypothetical protein IW138_004262 [Coemansia sp. RSA 986]KAJ2569862.1 hypothetical protein IW140_002750 [Coemansia sp. RSA 1813]
MSTYLDGNNAVHTESDRLLRPPSERHYYARSSRSSIGSSTGFSSDASGVDTPKYYYGSIQRHQLSTCAPPIRRERCARLPDTIDNTGSTARDFYAAERNFLSWVRLSLALASTGAMLLTNTGVTALTKFGQDMFATALHLVAALTLVASLCFLYHTHAQLAVSCRPLRWSRTLSISMVVAAAATAIASAVAASAAILAPRLH